MNQPKEYPKGCNLMALLYLVEKYAKDVFDVERYVELKTLLQKEILLEYGNRTY